MNAVAGFDWDAGNLQKCLKHGVTVADIESVFAGQVMVSPDPAHSAFEDRFKAIGKTANGRYVFLIFTLRGHSSERLIRPISARFMHQKEIAHYENPAQT